MRCIMSFEGRLQCYTMNQKQSLKQLAAKNIPDQPIKEDEIMKKILNQFKGNQKQKEEKGNKKEKKADGRNSKQIECGRLNQVYY